MFGNRTGQDRILQNDAISVLILFAVISCMVVRCTEISMSLHSHHITSHQSSNEIIRREEVGERVIDLSED